ncbi:MAG: outer membrane lipoprotein-sorting protein [Bacteriovoracia bacterium]
MRILIILATLLSSTTLFAEPIRLVVQEVQDKLAPKNFTAQYHFKNYRLDGTISEYVVQIEARNVNLQHISFTSPEREKGRELLRNGEQLWSFVPSVGRIVKIEDRESFAGGDFSNADVLRVDWLNQYNPTLAKETKKQWIVDLTAKGKQASYAKMRLWIKKENKQPVQQEFFDSNGTTLKRLRYGKITSFGFLSRPAFLEMENVITGQKSELTVRSLNLNQKISESRFVMDNLGK